MKKSLARISQFMKQNLPKNMFLAIGVLPLSVIPIVACSENDSLIELNDQVRGENFLIKWNQGKGSVETQDLNLSLQLELRYVVSNDVPSSDLLYHKDAPNNLSNGEIVWIKAFVKNEFEKTYKTNQTPLSIKVDNSVKKVINASIHLEQFTFRQSADVVVITYQGPALPTEVEVRYAVGPNEPLSAANYSTTTPSNLGNGATIWMKLFIKPAYRDNFSLANSDTIHKVINGFARTEINFSLSASDLTFIGNASQGMVSIAKEIPSQIEARFAIANAVPSDQEFSPQAPRNLANGQRLWVKLFVKSEFLNTHTINASAFSKDVTNLTILDLSSTTLNSQDIAFIGEAARGSVNVVKNLAGGLEPRYFVGETAPTNDLSYEASINSLRNGETVWIKLFVRSGQTNNFSINFNPISKVVSGLSKITRNFTLNPNQFTIGGVINDLTVDYDANLDPVYEFRYAKANVEPTDLANYNASWKDFTNNDKLFIRVFVKPSNEANYSVTSNALSFTISNLLPRVILKMDLTNFEIEYDASTSEVEKINFSLTLVKGASFDNRVELRYAIKSTTPSEGDFSASLPKELADESKVWVKYVTKPEYVKDVYIEDSLTSFIAINLYKPYTYYENKPFENFIFSGLAMANNPSNGHDVNFEIGAQGFKNFKAAASFALPKWLAITKRGAFAYADLSKAENFFRNYVDNYEWFKIEHATFYRAKLPIGFKIPRAMQMDLTDSNLNLTQIDENSNVHAFYDAILPEGCAWYDAKNVKIVDQNAPTQGSIVKKIV